MSNVQAFQAPKKRGRPAKVAIDPLTVELLSIPDALTFTRKTGRGISRVRLMDLLLSREVLAMEDFRHLDRFGKPLLMVVRASLEDWLRTGLRVFDPASHVAAKGA